MFLHTLKYNLKTLFKNRTLVFWTYVFPLVLGLLFFLAFSNIENDELFKVFDIGVIKDNEIVNNEIYKKTLEELSNDNNKDKLFNIKYLSISEADELLEKKDIEGYILLENNKPKLVFKTTGLNQTVIKTVVDEIEETTKVIYDLVPIELANNPDQSIDNIVNNIIIKLNSEVILNNKTNGNISYMTVEYFTLIGMTCMYAAMISIQAINQALANMSSKGKRVSIAKTKKTTVVLSAFLASYIVAAIGIAILLMFILFGLNINFGNHVPQIILLSLVGTLAGTGLGLLIASTLKVSETSKIGITLSFSMTMSFLAGMMGVILKYKVDTSLPLLNKINPVNMITDGFYSLYYYDTFERFNYNVISLLVFTFVCLLISYISLRRQRYDSI